jgi:hypothetical protein
MILQPPEYDFCQLIHRFIDLVLPSSNDLWKSADKLGAFLTICTELGELEKIARHEAECLLLNRETVRGWTIVHKDGNRYVPTDYLRKLVFKCPASQLAPLLEALVKALGSTSEAKYRALCSAAGLEPDQEAIQQIGATVFLRQHAVTNEVPTTNTQTLKGNSTHA